MKRDPNATYTYGGQLYGPDQGANTVAVLDRISPMQEKQSPASRGGPRSMSFAKPPVEDDAEPVEEEESTEPEEEEEEEEEAPAPRATRKSSRKSRKR